MFIHNAKAVSYKIFGAPDKVLKLINKTVTKPASHEIIVKMSACSINPSDLLAIRGIGYYKSRIQLPAIPGFEGVGVVVAKGAAVKHVQLGQRVLALRGEGTWQAYVKIPALEAICVPDEINDLLAAQLYINPLTAWLIVKKLQVTQGHIVIANAAGSAMGKLFAQFSHILGYTYIAVTRSNDYTSELLRLGAAYVINTHECDLTAEVYRITQGQRPHIALEAVGGKPGAELAMTVRSGGKVLVYGNLALQTYPAEYLKSLQPHVSIENFWLRDWTYRLPVEERKQVFREMMNSVITHNIELPIAKEFKLDDVIQAVQNAETPGRQGKILLTFS